MFPVNVSPDMAMYTLLVNQGYEPIFALCEFIDNSLHAHNTKENCRSRQLRMKLKFYSNEYHDPELKNSIIIEDDGPGIPKDALQGALKPAKPPARKGLSEFGIGMKSAAIWFADEWQLDTWPENDGVHLTSVFNLTKLLEEGIDTINVSETKDDIRKRGTCIALRCLRKDLHQPGYDAICAGISEIYQRFLSGDSPQLEITTSYNGTEKRLRFENPPPEPLVSATHQKRGKKTVAVGEVKEWKVDVNFIFQGHPVKGFIQLRSVGSYRDNPGLVLFRHNRVICGIIQKRYIPLALYKTSNKARAMLVYGEMDLDGFPVSFTKDKFTFDDDDFVRALTANVKGLSALLAQADNRRKNAIPDTPNTNEGSEIVSGGGESSRGSSEPPSNTDPDSSAAGGPNVSSGSSASVVTSVLPGGTGTWSSTADVSVSPVTAQHKLPSPKPDTRIRHTSAIASKLGTLESDKLSQLYFSLGKISLTQHSAIMYVAAWVFFESLARRCGASSNQSFLDCFNSRMNNEWAYERDIKKSYSLALKNISEKGNCAKHCGYSFPIDARQLANDFEVLEPVILRALDDAIALSNTTAE